MSNEHIEEMAKDLQETYDYEDCEAWHCGGCRYEKYSKNYFCSSIKQAEKMIVKGYIRQSEVIAEYTQAVKHIAEGVKFKNNTEKTAFIEMLEDLAKMKGGAE